VENVHTNIKPINSDGIMAAPTPMRSSKLVGMLTHQSWGVGYHLAFIVQILHCGMVSRGGIEGRVGAREGWGAGRSKNEGEGQGEGQGEGGMGRGRDGREEVGWRVDGEEVGGMERRGWVGGRRWVEERWEGSWKVEEEMDREVLC
jgi:hypothetical protein